MKNKTFSVDAIHFTRVYFDWSGQGFGQLEVFKSKDGTLVADNECMSRESVREMLHAWADFIADRVILRDNPEDIPPIDYLKEQE